MIVTSLLPEHAFFSLSARLFKGEVTPGGTRFHFADDQAHRHPVQWTQDQMNMFRHNDVREQLETILVAGTVKFFEKEPLGPIGFERRKIPIAAEGDKSGGALVIEVS